MFPKKYCQILHGILLFYGAGCYNDKRKEIVEILFQKCGENPVVLRNINNSIKHYKLLTF